MRPVVCNGGPRLCGTGRVLKRCTSVGIGDDESCGRVFPLIEHSLHLRAGVASKKAIILEYRAEHRLEHAGIADIDAIQAALRARLGEKGTSRSYIANVLREAGTQVELPAGRAGIFAGAPMPHPYAARLNGMLEFADFERAERCLRNLDAAYREYSSAGDQTGLKLVRSLALTGKSRARSLSANSSVNGHKRDEKHEIAEWFRLWLQAPDLFFEWLELRKTSDEFQRRFTRNGATVQTG
jgi:hypothetical protein